VFYKMKIIIINNILLLILMILALSPHWITFKNETAEPVRACYTVIEGSESGPDITATYSTVIKPGEKVTEYLWGFTKELHCILYDSKGWRILPWDGEWHSEGIPWHLRGTFIQVFPDNCYIYSDEKSLLYVLILFVIMCFLGRIVTRDIKYPSN
jgi:hypothetical protein